MSKEKQIEEMANDLRALDCLQHNPNYSIEYQRAIGLYSLGYRRSTDVAREIFEELEKKIAMHGTSLYGLCLMSMGEAAFAELKKKYTEDVE